MGVYRYKTKEGTKYYFKVSIFGKSYLRRGFNTKKEAEKASIAFQCEFKHDSKKYLFNDVVFLFLKNYEQTVKRSTYMSSKYIINNHILNRIPNIDISTIRYDHLLVWRKYVSKTKYKKKNNLISLLVKIFDYGSVYLGVTNNEAKKLNRFKSYEIQEPEEKRGYITLEEFKKLLSFISEDIYRLLFSLAFFTGLRISEARGLQVKCYKEGKLFLYQQANDKLGYGKTVLTSLKTIDSVGVLLLPEVIKVKLDEFIKVHNLKDNHFIFYIRNKKEPIGENSIRRELREASKKAGLNFIGGRFHIFRHSEATLLFEGGIKPTSISKYLRHSSDVITKKYYIEETEKDKRIIKGFLDEIDIDI